MLVCTSLAGRHSRDFINVDGPFPQIRTLLLCTHGSGYNPRKIEGLAIEAAKKAGQLSSTAILTMQWMRDKELQSYGLKEDPDAPWMLWSDSDNSGWKGLGDASSTDAYPRPQSMQFSSLEVFELLLSHMTDCKKFPNLRNIVVMGHSGGGYLVQRLMLASALSERLINNSNYRLQYMSAGNTYFAYFDSTRAVDPDVEPSQLRMAPFDATAKNCSSYDKWGCGYRSLPRMLKNITAEEAARRHRNTYVTVGAEDTGPKDKTCEMAIQGSHRLNKQRAWAAYLKHFFGEWQ
ncbi:hypothetical protein HYH03_004798 [Edaphochlamys debaryana]|uniref:Uncharacterized protein n=1 Tax=Edaphochlamys debaryana TaxID=47281 RepID=A0A835YGK9_9CHLO|nr:hypothetical protein HYH03_004798 [Edaphochlamys debaryana]|eukprot:KAG2497209.1 hypothetical protein HYH03_004798 [Edaphochlamys debaryana]